MCNFLECLYFYRYLHSLIDLYSAHTYRHTHTHSHTHSQLVTHDCFTQSCLYKDYTKSYLIKSTDYSLFPQNLYAVIFLTDDLKISAVAATHAYCLTSQPIKTEMHFSF